MKTREARVALKRSAALLQALEPRRLMASINVTNAELVLTGDAAKSNTISLSLSSDGRTYSAAIGTLKQTIAANAVRALRVTGGTYADSINLGSTVPLDSVITPGSGNDTVYGGAGSDNVFDTSGYNQFYLRGGHDFVSGGNGGDTVDGSDGNDIAFLNSGTDKFTGGTGNDYFDGGDGTDTADGGSGTDYTLNTENRTNVEYHPGLSSTPAAANSKPSGGTLTITGLSSSANVIRVVKSGSSFVVTGGAKRATYSASSVARIVVTGGSQADYIGIDSLITQPVSVTGGSGDDTLVTAGGNDTVYGNDGDDRITTQGGNDSVVGGSGDDTLDSGSGNDKLFAESGNDRADGGSGTDSASGVEYSAGIETGTDSAPTVPTTPNNPSTPTPSLMPSNPSAATPTPVISALTTNLTAGQSLFVHGLNSKYGTGSQHTARFEWNFGDTGGDYNTLVGFNAGHVYERAGRYTVTLKLWNDKRGFKQTTMTVNVASAGRQAIYVSASGNDGGSGSSSGSPVRTMGRAASLAKGRSNVEILLRGGDTFSSTSSTQIHGSNVRIASYGSGKATLKWDGARDTSEIIIVNEGAVGTVVENIKIDSKFTGPESGRSGMPFGVKIVGDRTTVRDVTFVNVGYAIQTNTGPTGVMVQNCDSPTLYGLRSYLLWAQGSDFVVLGNKVANSTNEHPVRVYGVDRMLMAYNDLANPTHYSFETSKMALNLQKGNDVYVHANTFRGPRVQIGPLGGADALSDKGGRLNDVVFESNKVFNTSLEIVHGVSNLYLRNNVFEFGGVDALRVDGYDSTYRRGITNLNVVNNTFVNTSTRGRLMNVQGRVDGITLVNNLYRADSMLMGSYGTAAIWVNGSSNLSGFTKISNNLWPVPNVSKFVASRTPGGTGFVIISTDLNDLKNYYNISRWNALSDVVTDFQNDVTLGSDFRPTSDFDLIDDAERNYAGVFGDINGKSRPTDDAWTIGAVQI